MSLSNGNSILGRFVLQWWLSEAEPVRNSNCKPEDGHDQLKLRVFFKGRSSLSPMEDRRINDVEMARPRGLLVLLTLALLAQLLVPLMLPGHQVAGSSIKIRVCDTREVKTVTNRVCMLYKRTKNSDVKLDRQGNLRITRQSKSDYSPAKLASECCTQGCPPHIFANIC